MAIVVDPNEMFAGNASINAHIHGILQKFNGPTQSKMLSSVRDVRRALDQATDDIDRFAKDAQARHIFREFLVGEHLQDCGYADLEYSAEIDGLTPDWLDRTAKLLVEVFTTERGGTAIPQNRFHSTLEGKASKYKCIVERHQLQFVIAIHPDFLVNMDLQDCEDAVRASDVPGRFPCLTGILCFAETWAVGQNQSYRFDFFPNPMALRPMNSISVGLANV